MPGPIVIAAIGTYVAYRAGKKLWCAYRDSRETRTPDELYRVGQDYETGRGVPRDDTRAFNCYRTAANRRVRSSPLTNSVRCTKLGRGCAEGRP